MYLHHICHVGKDEWKETHADPFGQHGFVYRPDCAQGAAWSGEGLPPAGTVCEVLNNTLDRPEWERCTILFMGKFKAIYESESCHERVVDVSESWIISFRPIRTPEQIAAEERREAILEMKGFLSFSDYREAERHCADLYDAGYRKVTP
ncbi:hypothetical protein [Stutzerimonas kunmingensis]|uniref:hypothetical protein n=1 Tax=Stutzerimonas kunmingensis TaxID=1211807 RepID=UPI0011B0AEEB|nr:hypothetical protein [Stutzerimonas kunmingensis]